MAPQLALALALAAGAALLAVASADECRSCSEAAFALTNDYRSQSGMGSLQFSEHMYTRCQQHSRNMASRGSLYHTALNDGVLAENVASNSAGGAVAAAMVRQWIGSPGHASNMRGPYACGATGIYEYAGKSYGTQMFGSCSDGAAAPERKTHTKTHYPAAEDTHYGYPHQPEPAYTKPPATAAPAVDHDHDGYPSYADPKYTAPQHPASPAVDNYGDMCRPPEERCMGADGYHHVIWKPCCEDMVCVHVPELGYGKHCIYPRWPGDVSEDYGDVVDPPAWYTGYPVGGIKVPPTAPPAKPSHYGGEVESPVTAAPTKSPTYYSDVETESPMTRKPSKAAHGRDSVESPVTSPPSTGHHDSDDEPHRHQKYPGYVYKPGYMAPRPPHGQSHRDDPASTQPPKKAYSYGSY